MKKNILIIYKTNHASTRVANSARHEYNDSKYLKKNFNIYFYITNKTANQKRLDRLIFNNNISTILVHKELIDEDCIKYIDKFLEIIPYTRRSVSFL